MGPLRSLFDRESRILTHARKLEAHARDLYDRGADAKAAA